MLQEKIKSTIRDVQDFPKEGILFKDITPILENSELTREITLSFAEDARKLEIDAIVGVESRGFFWGTLVAQELGIPFIPVRKKGKLPYKTVSYKYDLEYGSSEIEMHEDAIQSGWKVLIHDDLLATGGTAVAAAEIVKMQGAKIAGFSFLVILEFLKGEKKLQEYSNNVNGLVRY